MDFSSRKILKEKYINREIVGGVYRILCNKTGEYWLKTTKEIKGAQNRFEFSKKTNTSPELYIRKKWEEFGANSFSFEVLETIKKTEKQTMKEFIEDTKFLLEIWEEKLEYNK